MSADTIEAVDALDLFKTEIRADDLSVRIDCIQHMDVIARAMGKNQALSTLVPLIAECVKGHFCSDDDELLLSFAKYLPEIVPFLPDGTGASALVPILESLASQDETVIRESAVESLGRIAATNASVCVSACFPALMRLYKAEWFSSKISASGLSPFVYPHVPEDSKAQIRSLFIACANDETPMVKRAAAFNLYRMVSVVEKPFAISELLPVYHTLACDETQDSVRSSCVAASISFCRILNESEAELYVRDTVAALATDKSWRVRLAVVKVYAELCRCMGRESTVSHLLEPLVALMKDQEPDVRKAAVVAFQSTASLLSASLVVTHFVPLFPVIGKDPVQQVRSALSECISPLARTLGPEFTLAHILPLLMESARDDHPTIRYNATNSIGSICAELKDNEAVVSQLVTLLHSQSQDANWRTRLAVLQQVPALCRLFGKELYESKLESLFLSFFGDSVHAVRDAISTEIGALVAQIGEEWTKSHFVPQILTLYSESNSYSSRVAILQTIPQLASVLSDPEDVKRLLLPTLVQGCKDSVPNVRFIACSVTERLCSNPAIGKAIKEAVQPSVSPLVNDQDLDVRFYANRVSHI